MISYTIGGPDVSIFRLSNDNSTAEPISYPGMSYLTWVVFAVVMSVLFLNLLVSLSGSAIYETCTVSEYQLQCDRLGWLLKMFRSYEGRHSKTESRSRLGLCFRIDKSVL